MVFIQTSFADALLLHLLNRIYFFLYLQHCTLRLYNFCLISPKTLIKNICISYRFILISLLFSLSILYLSSLSIAGIISSLSQSDRRCRFRAAFFLVFAFVRWDARVFFWERRRERRMLSFHPQDSPSVSYRGAADLIWAHAAFLHGWATECHYSRSVCVCVCDPIQKLNMVASFLTHTSRRVSTACFWIWSRSEVTLFVLKRLFKRHVDHELLLTRSFQKCSLSHGQTRSLSFILTLTVCGHWGERHLRVPDDRICPRDHQKRRERLKQSLQHKNTISAAPSER